jgi:carbon monoxide dehydrogenase subunit G
MKITETFRVDNSRQKVWDFISDVHKIASCLPSVQSVQVLDDKHYQAIVKQKVGFISATFEIKTEVIEKLPPSRIVLSNKGKSILGADGTLASVDTITLTALSDKLTEVKVESELKLGGVLAVLGAKLIESKSREIFAEATRNLKARTAEL